MGYSESLKMAAAGGSAETWAGRADVKLEVDMQLHSDSSIKLPDDNSFACHAMVGKRKLSTHTAVGQRHQDLRRAWPTQYGVVITIPPTAA